MDKIILKQLTGESLTEQEKVKLDHWLRADVKNRIAYNQLKLAFLSRKDQFDGSMKTRVKERILAKARSEFKVHQPVSSGIKGWKKVAIWLLVACCGILFYEMARNNYLEEKAEIPHLIEKISLDGQKVAITLPDGTKVKLNASSKLITPDKFEAAQREVTLIGEAFFEVAENPKKPFIIHIAGLHVEVLGTSFNIDTYALNKDHTSIAVATGKVRVKASTDSSEAIDLVPGQMLTHARETGVMKVQNFDWDKELAWKDNFLVFKNDNIHTILSELERWYGVDTQLDKVIAEDKYFTGKYNNPTLESVLRGLSFVYDFEYSIDHKKVIIK